MPDEKKDLKVEITRYKGTLFSAHINKELSEETKKSLDSIEGVETVIHARYSSQFTVSPMFDISQVETAVCNLIRSRE